jgi:hypothetical protein
MFANTALSSDILAEIALRIKEYTDGSTHVIDLGYVTDDSIVTEIQKKGWTVTFNKGKYATCSTVDDVKAIEPIYTKDVISGVWSESLSSLINGDSMFNRCYSLKTFNADLSSLINGDNMFDSCSLSTFSSDLSSLV